MHFFVVHSGGSSGAVCADNDASPRRGQLLLDLRNWWLAPFLMGELPCNSPLKKGANLQFLRSKTYTGTFRAETEVWPPALELRIRSENIG